MLGVGSYPCDFYQLFTLKADDINRLCLLIYKGNIESKFPTCTRWQGQLRGEDGQLLPNAAVLVRVPLGDRLRTQH